MNPVASWDARTEPISVITPEAPQAVAATAWATMGRHRVLWSSPSGASA